MSTLALIGLGSNLGDRKSILDGAVAALATTPGIELRRVSTYHETAPVGGPSGQGAFLNAAAAVETSLDPAALHLVLRGIEAHAGRVRKVRWDARTLDLDLLLFGDLALDEPDLQVPHPRMALRRFVMAPLAEIAPSVVEPRTGRTILDLLANLDRRPGYVAIASSEFFWWTGEARKLFGYSFKEAVRDDRWSAFKSPIYLGLLNRLSNAQAIDAHRPAGRISPLGPSSAPAPSLDLKMRDALYQLDRSSWSGRKPESWLLTDYWFDEFYLRRRKQLAAEPAEFLLFRQEFLELRQQVLQPTIVVVVEPIAQDLELRPDRSPQQDPIGRDVPLLIPESRTVDAIVEEILAACQSSRP